MLLSDNEKGSVTKKSKESKRQAFAQRVREAKIAFLRQFYGIGVKPARNIWMNAYHPEFYDTIAIDQRIKKETEALGYSLTNYAEHDRFYQDVAKETSLQGAGLGRLPYNHRDEFLAVIS